MPVGARARRRFERLEKFCWRAVGLLSFDLSGDLLDRLETLQHGLAQHDQSS